MKLSTKSRYGVRLMVEMTLQYNRGPIRLGDIARRQGIPSKYLEQIIIPLKKAKYLSSVRGPRGGHMLTVAPDRISVGEIVVLLEGGINLTKCTANPEICARSDQCITRILWEEATEAILEKLNRVTFADLAQRARLTDTDEIAECPCNED